MAAHGAVVPGGVTYLVFSDCLRPALRLTAMMGLPAGLSAIPNPPVFRPADAVEAAECWELALASRAGPSCLVFARQAMPAARSAAGANRSARGAYVLAEAEGGRRDATILATGTEVGLAMAARAILAHEGIDVAVVSMPCWELFEREAQAYRRAVPGTAPRVGVEAAVRLGWDRWIGSKGAFVGMTGFGASGKEDDLWPHFAITAEAVAGAVRASLR